MRTSLIAVLVVAGLSVVGCTRDDKLKQDHKKTHEKVTSTQPAMGGATKDACTHCEGMQTATTDGKCPMCGMKM